MLILTLCSSWQARRVLITPEFVSFAFVGKELEIDRIPLKEVDFVKSHLETPITQDRTHVKAHLEIPFMQDRSHNDTHGYESQSPEYFCLQIATNSEGYNSGRTYTLRTRSKELHDEVLSLLKKLAEKSKKRAEANTWFRKCQWQVRAVYDHNISQSIIALIIMGVSSPPSSTTFTFRSALLSLHRRSRPVPAELRLHPRRGAVQPVPAHQPGPRPAALPVQRPLHHALHPRAPRLRLRPLAQALPPRPLLLARHLCGAAAREAARRGRRARSVHAPQHRSVDRPAVTRNGLAPPGRGPRAVAKRRALGRVWTRTASWEHGRAGMSLVK